MPDSTAALTDALTRVGDRWTLHIVGALLAGPRRFGELLEEIPGLASNILAARLRDLQCEKLVVAVPYSRRPLRVDYQLTASGAELAGALRLLAAWAAGPDRSTGEGGAQTPIHEACGTPVEVRWWCPTCARVADGSEETWA